MPQTEQPLPATEADAATFVGRPWREVATLAARVLTGSSLERIDEVVSGAAEALGPFEAPPFMGSFVDSAITGIVTCPEGGSLSWERSTQNALGGGRGIAYGDAYNFANCSVNGTRFDGAYATIESNGTIQAFNGSTDVRDYGIGLVLPDGLVVRASGTFTERFAIDGTQPCEPRLTTTRSAVLAPTLDVLDSSLGISLSELTIENESITSVPRGPDELGVFCTLRDTAHRFDDRARFTPTDAAVGFQVNRTGTLRTRVVSGPTGSESVAPTEASDAVLDITTTGGAMSRLRIEATGMNSTALVIIDDNGSTISFEAPWPFGREAGQ